jgi:hypothetical protein
MFESRGSAGLLFSLLLLIPSFVLVPDEAPPVRNVSRRKSVFAETYNPEEDEDDKPSVRKRA